MYIEVNKNSSVKNYKGWSVEPRPKSPGIGDTFYEMDTRKRYEWDGTEWKLDESLSYDDAPHYVTKDEVTKLFNDNCEPLAEGVVPTTDGIYRLKVSHGSDGIKYTWIAD